MCSAAGQGNAGSLPRPSGHTSVILNGRAQRRACEAADDAAQCCYTPRAVFGNTEAACHYSGSQWEQLKRALFSPAKRRKKGESRERDTKIQEMPEREAATAGPISSHTPIRPHIDHPHMIYPSPVIASLFREAVVIYEILK